MAYVFNLVNYRPPARQGGVKWTFADVYEAATVSQYPSGGTLIQSSAIPNYADAAAPPLMTIEVNQATLISGWYWIVFRDANGGLAPTLPEGASGAGVLLPPNPEEVRQRSAWIESTFPAGVGSNDERLREAVADATAIVESLTCRSLQGPLGIEGVENLDRLAIRAVTMKTERILGGEGTADARAPMLGTQRLKSFTAGPYSETYADDAKEQKMLDPDPAAHEVLWALATDDCRDQWLVLWGMGSAAPFTAVRAFAYPGHALQRPRRRY